MQFFIFFWIILPISFCSRLVSVLPNDYTISERKYIIYDVNHGEGFNLRRDVYMRVANAVRILRNNGCNYVLVLPPWGGLYHWRREEIKLPWSLFFDVGSLNEFIPVMEFEEFRKEINHDGIDEIVYLQPYAEGWTSRDYVMKYNKRPCIQADQHYTMLLGKWHGWFFSYDDLWARNFSCVSIQGDSDTLVKMIEEYYPNVTTLFVDRAEQILHSSFGDKYYWEARRSMRYAQHLINIGNKFRVEKFGSSDLKDRTVMTKSWTQMKKKPGDALGGDFLCVHWRRRDFVHSHSKSIPSIKGTAEQIIRNLHERNLTKLFLSTDAVEEEFGILKKLLPLDVHVERYIPEELLSDGEVSIIDQWICSHSRWFIGTHYSTFSYRIHEDREILGFPPETTFNSLCPDNESDCEQPAQWKIIYEKSPYE